MFLSRHCLLLSLVLVWLSGCDTAPASEPTLGAMRLAISLAGTAPGDVSRVTLTVSGAGMETLSTDLVPTAGAWGGVLGDIPAGPGRAFHAQAFTASNTLRYEGRVEDVTITAGATGLLSLLLRDVSTAPPFTNELPVIDSLVTSRTLVTPGGKVILQARARDPNTGDSVSYAWSAPSGSFSAPTQANTTWTASTYQAPVLLTLTVGDSRGSSLSVSLTVEVSAGRGAAQVSTRFNTPPRVTGMTSSRSILEVGQQTELTVSATDPDGDALSYAWTSSCAGTFRGGLSSSTAFSPTALPTAACNNCSATVTIQDNFGGQTSARQALCISRNADQRAPPFLTRSLQSSLTAGAGQVLTFEVGASDPAGSALTFAWAARTGTLGSAVSGASSSRVAWTAPACAEGSRAQSVTATVTNASGLKVSRLFSVTGLPRCPTAIWTPTGDMIDTHSRHTATLLDSGKVLIVGRGAWASQSAELYDPATGTWRLTHGSTRTERAGHTATPLSNGRVLIVGGTTGLVGTALTSVEEFDPSPEYFYPSYLYTARAWHTATRLPSGKVLVAGGSASSVTATAEVYDPVARNWGDARSMSSARSHHTATLLPTGKVLVAGGLLGYDGLKTAELYDPATDTWSPTGPLSSARSGHTATLLPTGKVLVVGGRSSGLGTELYDPATGTWSPTGALKAVRAWHTATLLPTGKVLVVGGSESRETAEVYDPATGLWSYTGTLNVPRDEHAAVLLSNGTVLVSGGHDPTGPPLRSAEIYDPTTGI